MELETLVRTRARGLEKIAHWKKSRLRVEDANHTKQGLWDGNLGELCKGNKELRKDNAQAGLRLQIEENSCRLRFKILMQSYLFFKI